jgi:hypothetical protein
LNHDAGRVGTAPLHDQSADVPEDPVEGSERHPHHAVIVGVVHGIEGKDDLPRPPRDQPPGDLGPEQRAVGREIVDDDSAQGEVVQELQDVPVEEGVAASREPHRSQARRMELVHQADQVRQRDLVLGAHVLLVAEVAGHVAPVGDVELGVYGAARGPARGDRRYELALAVFVDVGPPV